MHKTPWACTKRWCWLQKCRRSLGDCGGSIQPKEEEISCQEQCHPWEEVETWGCRVHLTGQRSRRSIRWGWGTANQGVRKWQRCDTSSMTLISASLFNILVNQDLNQNRGFSGSIKVFSKIWPVPWPGELKEQGTPQWFCRTPFSRMSHQLMKVFLYSTKWA